MILRILALSAVLLASPCWAGDVRIHVTDERGRPVVDAVATIHVERPPPGPIRFAWPMRIAQRNMQFDPFVLIAPAGAAVAFPNLDDVRHQVYSFSEAGPFELRLYGHDETRSVQFRNVGVVSIGCNIHDQMAAFIYVTDTPFAMKTNADGEAVLADVPAGAATLHIWHPYLRGAPIVRTIAVPSSASSQSFQLRLRAPPDRRSAY